MWEDFHRKKSVEQRSGKTSAQAHSPQCRPIAPWCTQAHQMALSESRRSFPLNERSHDQLASEVIAQTDSFRRCVKLQPMSATTLCVIQQLHKGDLPSHKHPPCTPNQRLQHVAKRTHLLRRQPRGKMQTAQHRRPTTTAKPRERPMEFQK